MRIFGWTSPSEVDEYRQKLAVLIQEINSLSQEVSEVEDEALKARGQVVAYSVVAPAWDGRVGIFPDSFADYDLVDALL